MTFSPAFTARVETRTGMAFAAIPVMDVEAIKQKGMGHIVAYDHETSTYVYWEGYPSYEDADGTELWRPEDARMVTLR